MNPKHLFAAIAVAAALAAPAFAADGEVRFPSDFRQFPHVTTGLVTPGFIFNGVDLGAQVPGLHNIYANRPALPGYRSLMPGATAGFNNGSVIVFDLWEPGTLTSGTGTFTYQSKRLAVAVMEKDAKKYASTGGWGFQVFDPTTRAPLLDAAAQQQCFACHAITPGTDFVFSKISN